MIDELKQMLINDGFKFNIHCDALDKGNTRVYFDDIDVSVVRFNNPKTQLIEWRNQIDGNMPVISIKNIIDLMVKI